MEASESDSQSIGGNKRKPGNSTPADKRLKRASRNKLTELDSVKKTFVSLFTLPQKFEEKSLTVFLKSKLKIKESFINKHLTSVKGDIAKALDPKDTSYDPIVGQMNIDFLLSIYVAIQDMNRVKGDDSTSIYNMPEANKELVSKNQAKDEIIKKKIQDIIIDNLTVTDTSGVKISSYNFVKSLLNAFDHFIRQGNDSISDDQIEKILEYLISLIDFDHSEQPDMEVEESKSSRATPQRSVVKSKIDPKEDAKSKRTVKSRSKETATRPSAVKVEKENKKKSEKESEVKEQEGENDDVSLAVPAILNFITGYFLSRTPQDINLEDHRRKRIEKRKKLSKKTEKGKENQKGPDIGEDDIKDDKGATSEQKICTFSKTRKKHQGQNWYECFTCGLTSNEGACVVCAVTCHRDHEIFYRGNSSFFCDCQFKFDCFALPDKYKERSQGRSGLGFGEFDFDGPGFDFDQPPWRREFGGRGGRGRGDRGLYRGGFRGDDMRRGRGRGGRGAPPGSKQFEVYRKSKKRSKDHKIKKTTASKEEFPSLGRFGMKQSMGGLFGDGPARGFNPENAPKRKISNSDSSSSSEEINKYMIDDGFPVPPSGSRMPGQYMGGIPNEFLEEGEDLMKEEDLLESEFMLRQLEGDGVQNDPRKLELLEELMMAKRMERSAARAKAPPPDDEGEDDPEGDDEGEEDEDEIIEEEKKEYEDEEEFKEPPLDLNQIDSKISSNEILPEDAFVSAVGDKKMEIAEDDSKSISSNDVKMDKDSLPIGSGEGRELDVIEEQNENKDEEEDIIMDEEEDFLNQPDRTYELFKKNAQTASAQNEGKTKAQYTSDKLLDKFQKLIHKIKKLPSVGMSKVKTASGKKNMEKICADLVEPGKRMIANTSGVSTKKNVAGGTIKMSSKAGDDGSGTLLMGIPGHTNYQVPKNIFTCNSVGLMAMAEGDVISFANINTPSPFGSEPNIIMKSVGIGFTITQMKYHPNND